MAFYVGQKVVCIDDNWTIKLSLWKAIKNFFRSRDDDPVKGRVYTVREIERKRGRTWLRLYECRNQAQMGFAEPQYASRNFRPVVERKTSIEIFKAMLNPSREGVSA